MKNLNAVWLAIMLMGLGVTVPIWASEPDSRLVTLKKLTTGIASQQVWWLKPTNDKWTNFDFIMIDGRHRVDLVRLLQEAVFADKAGNFYVMDPPFDYADKKGQGILVVQSIDGDSRIGFRFRAENVNKNAIEFINLT